MLKSVVSDALTAKTAKHKLRPAVWLKTSVTLGALVWLLAYVDWVGLTAALAQVSPVVVLAAVLLHAGAFLIGAVRWWVLLRRFYPSSAFTALVPGYFLASALNQVLPGGVGGDVLRPWLVGGLGYGISAVAVSTVLDRVLGLAGILVMGDIALLWLPEGGWMAHRFAAIAVVTTALIFLVAALFTEGSLSKMLPLRWVEARVGQLFFRSWRDLRDFRHERGALLLVMALVWLSQAAIVAVYVLIGRELGIDLTVAEYFGLIATLFVVSALPISIGGLGLREGVLVAMLVAKGVSMGSASALAVAYLAVLWLSLTPGIALAARRWR